MGRSGSLGITCGLAVVLATVLWMWQRDDPRHAASPTATSVKRERTDVRGDSKRGGSEPRDERSDDAWQERGAVPPPPVAAPKKPAPRLEDLPTEVRAARAEAFRRWHDNANVRLMRCMPPWTEQGEVREVRVHFRPAEPPLTEGEPPRIQADEVEPLEAGASVPDEVRRCLDQLRDLAIELPAQAPEVEYGHQEIIHVMWG